MTFSPSNVTGQEVSWIPTNQLRYAGRRRKNAELEQLWVNPSTKESEWREIPFVHEVN